jgi:glycerol-3-phosphate dehydrogenase (NAD(P)+)
VAIAGAVATRGQRVWLLCRTVSEADALVRDEYSPRHPEIRLPSALVPTADRNILRDAEVVILAVPAQSMRANVGAIAEFLSPEAALVVASKGLEVGSCHRMSEVVAAEAGNAQRILALSGPNLAAEVMAGKPAASVIACHDRVLAGRVQTRLGTPMWRLYVNHDVTGVEIGGALKNVVAVAAGIADGLGFGENARAALVTRGLWEITRLAVRLGGDARTLAGLAGLGDLVATCGSPLSRNRTLGLRLAAGERLDLLLAGATAVAEGVPTTRAAVALGARTGVEMPIAGVLDQVFEGTLSAREGAARLVGRAPGHEFGLDDQS